MAARWKSEEEEEVVVVVVVVVWNTVSLPMEFANAGGWQMLCKCAFIHVLRGIDVWDYCRH